MQRNRYIMGVTGGLILAMAIIVATSFASSGLVGGLTSGSASPEAGGAQVTTVYGVSTVTMTSTEAASSTTSAAVPMTVSSSTTSAVVSSTMTGVTTTAIAAVTAYTTTTTAAQTTATATSTEAMSTTGGQPSNATGANSSVVFAATTVVTTTTEVSTIHAASRGNLGILDNIVAPHSYSSPNNSPSSVRVLLTKPAQSAILLLPILLAVILGLVFFRASSSREENVAHSYRG